MEQNKPLPVHGYTGQSDHKIGVVNNNKELEEVILRLLDAAAEDTTLAVDKRWLSIARTHFEQGFMALNRSIFKPQRIALSDDKTE